MFTWGGFNLASFSGHSQVLSCSCGEKSNSLVVDSIVWGTSLVFQVTWNQPVVDVLSHILASVWPVEYVYNVQGGYLIFLHSCEMKSGSGLGKRLVSICTAYNAINILYTKMAAMQ